MSVETKIIKTISKVLKVKSNVLNKKTSIGDLPEWDSMGHLNIYLKLQKQFKTKINLDAASKVRSVNDWINIIKKKI